VGPLFVERCREYLTHPPDAEWAGVTRMTSK
jgi:hypothetical protein